MSLLLCPVIFCVIQLPISGGRVRVFIYQEGPVYFFFLLPQGKHCLLLSCMFNMSQILSIKKFTSPRKQQTKMGLQKGTENAAESICCPVLKLRRQMHCCLYCQIVSGYIYPLQKVHKPNLFGPLAVPAKVKTSLFLVERCLIRL